MISGNRAEISVVSGSFEQLNRVSGTKKYTNMLKTIFQMAHYMQLLSALAFDNLLSDG